jgi:hypothetical protein
LAKPYATTKASVSAFDDYLDKVTFQPEHGPKVTFVPAMKDKFNLGVIDENG